MIRKLGVILLSGGLDSTTAATQAVREGYDLVAVTVHYGQLHTREVDSAAEVARSLGLRHEVVDVSFFRQLAWYSALTNPERFTIPEGAHTRRDGGGDPHHLRSNAQHVPAQPCVGLS